MLCLKSIHGGDIPSVVFLLVGVLQVSTSKVQILCVSDSDWGGAAVRYSSPNCAIYVGSHLVGHKSSKPKLKKRIVRGRKTSGCNYHDS